MRFWGKTLVLAPNAVPALRNMTGFFMPNPDPDNYHDQSSLEIQTAIARSEREDYLEAKAESLRAQQQDADDQAKLDPRPAE